jgi:hypothetical protein
VDFSAVDAIARAILYEGYRLYPYRKSALKNRQPFMFGSLYPKAHCLATGETERWSMQTECLVRGGADSVLHGAVRFLHPGDSTGPQVVEREIVLPAISLARLPCRTRFEYGEPAAVQGWVELSAEALHDSIFKVRLRIANETHGDCGDEANMLSVHTVLGVSGGRFLSLIDPPGEVRSLAEACRNRGLWPVLVGDRTQQNMILAAPIILYDFPQIARESPGDLFDGTEIDELLTLRILTLTEAEKQAMRDEAPTRTLLERTENLGDSRVLALHGTTHSSERFEPGDRVRLRPGRRADILDLALDGKTATIVAIEQDFEGRVFFAVTVDDDPGRDLGTDGKPGHRFFFRREELVAVSEERE